MFTSQQQIGTCVMYMQRSDCPIVSINQHKVNIFFSKASRTTDLGMKVCVHQIGHPQSSLSACCSKRKSLHLMYLYKLKLSKLPIFFSLKLGFLSGTSVIQSLQNILNLMRLLSTVHSRLQTAVERFATTTVGLQCQLIID